MQGYLWVAAPPRPAIVSDRDTGCLTGLCNMLRALSPATPQLVLPQRLPAIWPSIGPYMCQTEPSANRQNCNMPKVPSPATPQFAPPQQWSAIWPSLGPCKPYTCQTGPCSSTGFLVACGTSGFHWRNMCQTSSIQWHLFIAQCCRLLIARPL